MTEGMRYFFGLYFIVWGMVVMWVLPDTTANKFINYVIIGAYVCAIVWWWLQDYPWWAGYWISALAITCVVTFGDLSTR
jgi:hypothetical protein